jgi:hypothetical protein
MTIEPDNTARLPSDADDADVAQMALEALRAAQRTAIASGSHVVLVDRDELVRISADGRHVLKKVPGRFRVATEVRVGSK